MAKDNKFKDFVSKPLDITGFSTINHNIRLKTGLTCSEYVLLDYIYTIQKKGKIPEMSECYRKTGFNDKEQKLLVQALIKKNMVLIPTSENQVAFDITEKWTIHFHNINAEFENLFWTMYDEEKKRNVVAWPGSKPQANKNYIIVRQNHSLEFLLEQRKQYFEYLKACHETGFYRQKMMCSVFLGPQERFLEDWKFQSEEIMKNKKKVELKEGKVNVAPATMKEIEQLYKLPTQENN